MLYGMLVVQFSRIHLVAKNEEIVMTRDQRKISRKGYATRSLKGLYARCVCRYANASPLNGYHGLEINENANIKHSITNPFITNALSSIKR